MPIHLKPIYCLTGAHLQQLTRNISPDPAVRYRRAWEQPGFVPTKDVEFLREMPHQAPITKVSHRDVVIGPACDRCASTGWMVDINPDADQKNWLTCMGKLCDRRLVLPVEWTVVSAQRRP